MLTTTQAAERLGLSPGRIIQLINRDQLPATQFGKAWAISESDLETFAAKIRKPGRSKGNAKMA